MLMPFYMRGPDSSAEVVLGKPAYVESTWRAGVLWVELNWSLGQHIALCVDDIETN